MLMHITLFLMGCSGPISSKNAATLGSDRDEVIDDRGHAVDGDSGLDTGGGDTGDRGEAEVLEWPITRAVTCYTAVADYQTEGAEIWQFRIDTGTVCAVVPLIGAPEDVYAVTSLGKEGDLLYGCDQNEQQLNIYDLASGDISHASTRCHAAAQWVGDSPSAGGIVLQNLLARDQFTSFVDLDAATSSAGDTLNDEFSDSVSRITISDDTLYATWHAGPELETWDLTTGDRHTVPLSGYQDWVLGLAVVDGVLIVLDYDGVLHAYDPITGEDLGRLRIWDDGPDQFFNGLTCEAEASSD